MGFVSMGRAILVRMMFALHGVISIWRLTLATDDSRFWYLGLVLCLLLVEMTVTLGKKQGKEWKWFCPSVFIYLMCVVPTMWFLELHELDKRLNVTTSEEGSPYQALAYNSPLNETKEELHADLGILGLRLDFSIPISLTSDQWIRTLEQLLLLLLIMGRWILPKGKLTHDQLSQLLLVYIGTAADIVEFFEAFKEDEVRNNWILCVVIMGIWSLSLIQFSLVLTATRVRRDRSGILLSTHDQNNSGPPDNGGCCSPDVYGIIISICLQDLPFLVLRMLLIFRYKVLSYTNMFFTCKNSIVIVLLIYRLVVIQAERRKAYRQRLKETTYVMPRINSSPSFASSSTHDNEQTRGKRHPPKFNHHNNSNHHQQHQHPHHQQLQRPNSNTGSADTISLSISSCSTRTSGGARLAKPSNSCHDLGEVRPNHNANRLSQRDLPTSRSHSPA